MNTTTESGSDVVVGGQRLHVDVRGDGPPVLLLMGIGGNLDMWEPVRAELAGYTTIAFDAPGTGASPTALWPLRLPGLARLALAVLDELGFDQVAVLGYSFGGMVAQQLARAAPERVDRLVLAATTCGIGAIPGRPEALAALWTPWRYYSASYFDLVAPTTFGGRARRGVESASREVRLGRPPSMIGYGQQLLALAGWSSLPWLHQIAAPTLVICGDDDPIVPVVNGRVLARRIPRARLAVVRGAGHLMLLDSAPDVVPLIQDFLAAPDP